MLVFPTPCDYILAVFPKHFVVEKEADRELQQLPPLFFVLCFINIS